MLPAPTSIAAAPSPRSRASWNPAVPPPPVGGGAVGNGLVEGLPVADGDVGGLTEGRAEGLVLARGVLTPAVPLDEALRVGEAVPAGEEVGSAAEGEDDVGSAAEGEDVVQAEIAAEASMATMPQPSAVSLAPSPVPAGVVRTFMEPPHASGRWRARDPVPHRKPMPERKTRGRTGRCPRRLRAAPRKREGP